MVLVASTAPPPPPTPPGKKYLLLDDRNIISSDAKFVLGAVEKHPSNPMITEERDYEMRFDNMQPNVWCVHPYKTLVRTALSQRT